MERKEGKKNGDGWSTYTEKTENARTGFRPTRSAATPQKTDATPLPIIYAAPEEKTGKKRRRKRFHVDQKKRKNK
jgi:hypothetical protein